MKATEGRIIDLLDDIHVGVASRDLQSQDTEAWLGFRLKFERRRTLDKCTSYLGQFPVVI